MAQRIEGHSHCFLKAVFMDDSVSRWDAGNPEAKKQNCQAGIASVNNYVGSETI